MFEGEGTFDVVVESARVSGDTTVAPGAEFTLTVTIANRGGGITPNINVYYLRSTIPLWFDTVRTVTYNGRFPLTSATFAAPSAQPMSLSECPPFQQLSPEIQKYLFQHLGEFVNVEAWQKPERTTLLSNYPNPFNPETWIPYQLAEPRDVTVTIYNIYGHVVRDLDLGHQRAGVYQSKSRAAYWDVKNAHGEPVASGVYFYALSAGDFTATRKMLIRKQYVRFNKCIGNVVKPHYISPTMYVSL